MLKLALIFGLLTCVSVFAQTLDSVTLDPAKVSCRTTLGDEAGSMKCDILFENLTVHEGRPTSPTMANGDCIKCRVAVDSAIRQQRTLTLRRGYLNRQLIDWNHDGLLTHTRDSADKKCD